ncbi:MAG: Wzz/FepE/Etk N-terminal domain-containing protein, partial [Anaerolineaceae bacterium]|nr:Wzz/FepE/Etk N-terminal domain-containing protein [Anaerolineaceae bacterium]
MVDTNEIELNWIFNVIRRRIGVIVAITVAAALVAFAAASWMPPVYEASAVLFVEPAQDTLSNEYSSLIAGERLAITYSQMLGENAILQAAIDQLNLDETPQELSQRVEATPISNTQLIRLTVKDSSPQQAARVTNTIAGVLITHIQELNMERYAGSLEKQQASLDDLSQKIDATRAQIDTLSKQIVTEEAELARLENLLSEYRDDYRLLQQSYQSIQLSMVQETDKVHVVDATQVVRQPGAPATYKAVVTLLVDPSLLIGSNTYTFSPTSERLVLTYGPMLVGDQMLNSVISQLQLSDTLETLRSK